mgnify:CR=1 FL=1
MQTHRAVVLFNLGGPDSLAAVEPFLANLFSDPDIFRVPLGRLIQKPLARFIARRRAPEAARGYRAIGGRSPLLENTLAQAQALQAELNKQAAVRVAAGAARVQASSGFEHDVYVCMRYWHPRATEVVAQLKSKGYTDVVLLPLYPQYSVTTSGSSYNEFMRVCRDANYAPSIRFIRDWYRQPDYQRAIVESLRQALRELPDPDPAHVECLFSAHGLPQKFVRAGDPYEQQVRATYEAIRAQLNWPHTTLCYQSRVGPLEWLKPYTDEVIRAKAAAGAKQILVYPIAFVSDHIETLYELGITYAQLARDCGVSHYRVVPALNAHPRLIAALRDLVLT